MMDSTTTRRRLLCRCGGLAALATLGASASLALSGCSREAEATAPVRPLDFDANAACALDGMLLADYPGPKGQLHWAGAPGVEWYCDTQELLAVLLRPEQVRRLRGAFVQDMARADWGRPVGHWTDARTAHYVVGSRMKGSMGVTVATFAQADAAQAFAARHGGRVLAFDAIRPEMVDLTGGALHDARM